MKPSHIPRCTALVFLPFEDDLNPSVRMTPYPSQTIFNSVTKLQRGRDSGTPAFKYIDSIEGKKHIVLFYEDREYARLVEFRFIKNGLDRNERCVYATEEDTGLVVLKMLSYGIPLSYFQNGMVQVLQVREKRGDVGYILEKAKSEAERLLHGLVPPFRIVSKLVPDVDSKSGIQAELEMEQATHKKFDNFGGSLICPYDISKIEPTRRKEWIKRLTGSHHVAIHVAEFGKSSVMCS